jgi:hypothetical protein
VDARDVSRLLECSDRQNVIARLLIQQAEDVQRPDQLGRRGTDFGSQFGNLRDERCLRIRSRTLGLREDGARCYGCGGGEESVLMRMLTETSRAAGYRTTIGAESASFPSTNLGRKVVFSTKWIVALFGTCHILARFENLDAFAAAVLGDVECDVDALTVPLPQRKRTGSAGTSAA